MPETVTVLFIFAVCVSLFLVVRFQSRHPANVNAAAELERLQLHEAWLSERLHRAEREDWGDDMIAGIAEELHATSRELDRMRIPVRAR